MRLDKASHRTFEDFFREFYGDDQLVLPKLDIFSGRVARLITGLFRLNGITLGRRIFIHPKFTWRDARGRLCAPNALIAHELTHAMQYEREGFFGFLRSYLAEFWTLLRKSKKWDFETRMQAYLDLPHEIEARRAARDFIARKLDSSSIEKT